MCRLLSPRWSCVSLSRTMTPPSMDSACGALSLSGVSFPWLVYLAFPPSKPASSAFMVGNMCRAMGEGGSVEMVGSRGPAVLREDETSGRGVSSPYLLCTCRVTFPHLPMHLDVPGGRSSSRAPPRWLPVSSVSTTPIAWPGAPLMAPWAQPCGWTAEPAESGENVPPFARPTVA